MSNVGKSDATFRNRSDEESQCMVRNNRDVGRKPNVLIQDDLLNSDMVKEHWLLTKQWGGRL